MICARRLIVGREGGWEGGRVLGCLFLRVSYFTSAICTRVVLHQGIIKSSYSTIPGNKLCTIKEDTKHVENNHLTIFSIGCESQPGLLGRALHTLLVSALSCMYTNTPRARCGPLARHSKYSRLPSYGLDDGMITSLSFLGVEFGLGLIHESVNRVLLRCCACVCTAVQRAKDETYPRLE